jgi:hypothetical protein
VHLLKANGAELKVGDLVYSNARIGKIREIQQPCDKYPKGALVVMWSGETRPVRIIASRLPSQSSELNFSHSHTSAEPVPKYGGVHSKNEFEISGLQEPH